VGSEAKEIVRMEGRSLELPSKRGLRLFMVWGCYYYKWIVSSQSFAMRRELGLRIGAVGAAHLRVCFSKMKMA